MKETLTVYMWETLNIHIPFIWKRPLLSIRERPLTRGPTRISDGDIHIGEEYMWETLNKRPWTICERPLTRGPTRVSDGDIHIGEEFPIIHTSLTRKRPLLLIRERPLTGSSTQISERVCISEKGPLTSICRHMCETIYVHVWDP